MPKRYTYLILKDMLHLASEVRRFAKGANSVFPTNEHEAQIRKDYWIHARANLQGLSGTIDDFLEIPAVLNYKDTGKTKGVTIHELEEIADLINEEMRLIANQIETEKKRYKNIGYEL